MTSALIRYKGFTWHHNPKVLKIQNAKKTLELTYPYDFATTSEMFRQGCVIKGEGELYGEDCIEQFNKLNELFAEKGEGVLSVGGLPSVVAIFKKLELLCEAKENVISYSFEFEENSTKEKSLYKTPYHIAVSGETLWHISNTYNVPVETLAKLNPIYKRPDSVKVGDKVILC